MNECKAKILSEDFCDFIISDFQRAAHEKEFVNPPCVQQMGPFYECYYENSEQANPITYEKYAYNSIPKCYTLLDMETMYQAGILQVQNFPTLELQGSGVLIGFVDTGINYGNEIFRNLDGTTRIKGIWDQTIQSGSPPVNFSFGTEYTEEKINQALQEKVPYDIVPSKDETGHGTFVASLAAGSAVPEDQFVGAAPSSFLAVVKLKPAKQYLKEFYQIGTDEPCYQENDIMLGVVYLNELAERLKLPLILCIALGTNQGSHSGSSPLAGLLDLYANQSGRCVVVGSGNEANERHHFLGNIGGGEESVLAEIRVEEGAYGFVAELWSEPYNVVQISVESPSGERTYPFPVRSGRTNYYTFLLEQTELSVDYKVFAERLDAEVVILTMKSPSVGIWKIIIQSVNVTHGQFHIWLPVKEFLNKEVYFLESNPDYTITEPGSVLSGITIGFYNGANNSVAIQSGRGYTRSMRIKPDFAAPGVNVRGQSAGERFVQRTGSSIAAGIAAGAAALIMEWVVYRLGEEQVTSTQIRDLLILGTEKRQGDIYPNKEWGYGALNVYNTFETLRRI